MYQHILFNQLISIMLEHKQIQEERNWDEYLAWCISQENSPHE